MNRRHFALSALALVPALSAVQEAVAAARKRKRKPKPKPRTITKFLTQTFSNTAEIRILDLQRANPYPSTIVAGGFTNARIVDVNLTLNGFSHGRPFDAALMLVSPSGKGAIVMHNVGGNSQVIGLTVTLDDQALVSMPNNPDIRLTSGTFKPTTFGSLTDIFPLPAPQGVTATTLDIFNGDDPNGGWQLYAIDDAFTSTGSLLVGWSLTITAAFTVVEPRKPRKRRKPRKQK